jgi:hypothetical protein
MAPSGAEGTVQAKVGFEYEVGAINTQKNTSWLSMWKGAWVDHGKGEVIIKRNGYDITADIDQLTGNTNLEFITQPIDESRQSELTRLGQIARDIVADMRAIFDASAASTDPQKWVQANQIPRLNGYWWHRFTCTSSRWDKMMGQLQMTGGVRVDRLADVVSGSAFGRQRTMHAAVAAGGGAVEELTTVSRYYQQNPARESIQPIWQHAWNAVVMHFGPRYGTFQTRRMVASALALMASTPIEMRCGDLAYRAGLLMEKTDFSKILLLIAEDLGDEIDERRFLNALVDTINSMVPAQDQVNANSDIFPVGHNRQGISFNGVTLRRWVEEATPVEDLVAEEGFIQGRDLLTSHHFPGTREQKKEMRAWGTFGSKTDPGNRVILEWRNFQVVVPGDLEQVMLRLADYLGRRVNG